jgi:hypothetical protein
LYSAAVYLVKIEIQYMKYLDLFIGESLLSGHRCELERNSGPWPVARGSQLSEAKGDKFRSSLTAAKQLRLETSGLRLEHRRAFASQ